LGVPQLKFKKSYKTQEIMYAIETLETINDEIYEYKTPVMKNQNEGLLALIFKAKKNRSEENCIVGITYVVKMALADDAVMEYLHKAPAPTCQNARFTDWFFDFAREIHNNISNMSSSIIHINNSKKAAVEALLGLEKDFDAKK